MTTEEILQAVTDAHRDLELSIVNFARGGVGAADAGKHIGMAKARLGILKDQLNRQIGRERAKFEAEAKAFNARVDKATKDWLRHLDGDQ